MRKLLLRQVKQFAQRHTSLARKGAEFELRSSSTRTCPLTYYYQVLLNHLAFPPNRSSP